MEVGARRTETGDSGWRGGGNEGMETITTILRQAREQKGVSLKDVEGQTRIPVKYLQALEGAGENGLLADEMYLIPFLRSYANFLGVDPNQAVTRFLTELQRQDAATVAPPEHRPPVVTPRSGPSRLASWVMPFLFLLVLLVVGSYLWQKGHLQTLMSWWQSRAIKEKLVTEPTVGTPPPPASALVPDAPVAVVPTPSTRPESGSSPGVAPPAGGPTPVSPTGEPSAPTIPPSGAIAVVPQSGSPAVGASGSQAPTGSSAPPASTPPVAAASPAAVARPPGGHHLSIQATSPTWMRVTVDNQPGKEMILKAGEVREWTAQDGFTLSLGNAGGVTLNLNGQELPPVGKIGQVVRNMRLPASPVGQ